jgi:hypothetical protein
MYISTFPLYNFIIQHPKIEHPKIEIVFSNRELVLESISSMETRFSHGGLEIEKEKAIFVKISMGGIKNLVSIFLCVGI